MVNIILAFVTGLTTGGLSCLAVQGGLLASSLAGQIEQDVAVSSVKTGKKKGAKAQAAAQTQNRAGMAQPILAFLVAKLLAYTALGFLLGLLGQMFQLSPIARAVLQIAIGIFMFGTAMRMLNVHPIFRYFAFEPPAAVRRKLRRTAANGTDTSLATPIFLGLLTVLIPCGVTQAMMAVALGTGSPVEGAALMFAFTLGTSPVFFAVAYFATRLGARLEKHFMRFVAVVVLLLAVVTIDGGLTLAGSPLSLTRALGNVFTPRQEVVAAPPAAAGASALEPFIVGPAGAEAAETADTGDGTVSDGTVTDGTVTDGTVITINVENYGYSPDVVHAKAGVPVKLRLVMDNVRSCSRAFIIPALNLQMVLPATGEEIIEIPAQPQGSEMPFSCSMGMYYGTIVFDL